VTTVFFTELRSVQHTHALEIASAVNTSQHSVVVEREASVAERQALQERVAEMEGMGAGACGVWKEMGCGCCCGQDRVCHNIFLYL
jgi:hypothetical protein